MMGRCAHTEREVGILDGILGLVHSGFTLRPSTTAQQLHKLLHRLTKLVHFLRSIKNQSQSGPLPVPQTLTASFPGSPTGCEVLKPIPPGPAYLFKEGELCLLWFTAGTLYILPKCTE